jgi:hypothetical protein
MTDFLSIFFFYVSIQVIKFECRLSMERGMFYLVFSLALLIEDVISYYLLVGL